MALGSRRKGPDHSAWGAVVLADLLNLLVVGFALFPIHVQEDLQGSPFQLRVLSGEIGKNAVEKPIAELNLIFPERFGLDDHPEARFRLVPRMVLGDGRSGEFRRGVRGERKVGQVPVLSRGISREKNAAHLHSAQRDLLRGLIGDQAGPAGVPVVLGSKHREPGRGGVDHDVSFHGHRVPPVPGMVPGRNFDGRLAVPKTLGEGPQGEGFFHPARPTGKFLGDEGNGLPLLDHLDTDFGDPALSILHDNGQLLAKVFFIRKDLNDRFLSLELHQKDPGPCQGD